MSRLGTVAREEARRLEEPAQPVGTLRWSTGGARGRELTEREMAYVSPLVQMPA